MPTDPIKPGLYEALLTRRLLALVDSIQTGPLAAELAPLHEAEASDRVSRHIAALVARTIERAPEGGQRDMAISAATAVIRALGALGDGEADLAADELVTPVEVLVSVLRRLPDGRAPTLPRPLTPLLDTTVFTNAPGEPAVGHEILAEVPSTDAIDVVMAFIRWSGVRSFVDVLRRHCEAGKPLRVLTTTYTNVTERRALDELQALGADIRVSYDVTATRLHAKAWLFHRDSGYSTAYIGSSNLSHAAQVFGLEWNVRVAEARNPDAVAKMKAVFESYWASRDFVDYDGDEFSRMLQGQAETFPSLLSPVEIELRPFQEALLEQVELARHQGHHRNLLVAATGTGKTVMAAVDYSRLRGVLGRSRLLFVAHRMEILEQSRAVFRHALRDASFGEAWVAGTRPSRFDHVFASIQSLNSSDVRNIDPGHFDVLVIDEFHHAAAPSYEALLEHLTPVELLGLTATPERSDGLDVLRYFDGRIAAELRLWDAIDQGYLAPFAYFGIHDGLDLRDVPWRRGRGYDNSALETLLTADDAWAHLVIRELERKIADPSAMRALGFCVSVRHAEFMADRFTRHGLPAVALSASSSRSDRLDALRALSDGTVCAVFTVDLFNEGVDVPAVDTLLLLRPTDSPVLFLQQLGRGLRKFAGKNVCTVLDFIGLHRKEFRFDRRFSALLGGTRVDVERQVRDGFPFLPAGCNLQLDPVAEDIVLRSIREAIPSAWRERCAELRSLGDVDLKSFLDYTGLELEDIYANGRSWTEMRRTAGLSAEEEGPNEAALLRAVGRLLHVDDDERLDVYPELLRTDELAVSNLSERERRLLAMLAFSLTTLPASSSLDAAVSQVWTHRQVRAELLEVLSILRSRVPYLDYPLGLGPVPLALHSRYTRTEILAAFGTAAGAKPSTWQTGVWWDEETQTDLFAFTFDKSVGGFSPTTRYRDYAINPELVHWESQSATASDSRTGQRYINHRQAGTNIMLFARLRTTDRAFWCLGPASYVSHEGDRPISFVWRLRRKLPAELYTSFAAAVA